MAGQLTSKTLYDSFFASEGGVNTGVLPSILPGTQLAHAANTSLRGGFPQPRPAMRKCELDFGSDTYAQSLFEDGRWQGACYYQPDSGDESLMCSIGGHLFQVVVHNQKFKVRNATISHTTVLATDAVAPAAGATVQIQVLSTANIRANVPVLIGSANYTVDSVDSDFLLTVRNVSGTPGATVPAGEVLTFFDVNPAGRLQAWLWQAEKWVIVNDGESVPIFFDGARSRRSYGIQKAGAELTAGRMGIYYQGRNWWVNPDGKTFRAGDTAYGSSGTKAERYRDAVLKQTQNTFLAEGGDFAPPANAGYIRAMQFVNVLDASLGQGPLQILTPTTIFGCNAPLDSAEWQKVTSPILSVSQISYGGTSQHAAILVNGDLLYRAPDGVRSLVIGRREIGGWGNTPISNEVTRYLRNDDPTLLQYSSAILFDNRVLLTCSPVFNQHGVYHRGMVSLNLDVVSSIAEKHPAVWEGVWGGLSTLQLVKGEFGGRERAFAFQLNSETSKVELYELLPATGLNLYDSNGAAEVPVTWSIETAPLFRATGQDNHMRVRVTGGEIYVRDIRGPVKIRVLWKPDHHPCWVEWKRMELCAETSSCDDDWNGCFTFHEFKPQYRPRLGLGEPPKDCDSITNKPYREGYTFQLRIEVEGHAQLVGGRLSAEPVIDSMFAPQLC